MEQHGQYDPDLESSNLGKVELDPNRHWGIQLRIGEAEVSAILPLHRSAEDPDYVVGLEETLDEAGERTRRYLKIPKLLREAGHTAVEYYETHENLKKGAMAASVVVGAVAVGSLVVLRLKNRRG